MSGSRRDLGRQAEDVAADFLRSKGLVIVTRRYSCRKGELDLVALDGDVIVFVEVKMRRDDRRPEESITAKKSTRIRLASRAYLREVGAKTAKTRFDVVVIAKDGLQHYANVEFGLADMLEKIAQDGRDAVDDELDTDHRRE